MKAIICTKYGPPEVLQLQEVEKPTPKANEVCIQIHATAVTASDCIIRGFKLPIWNPIGFLMGLVVGFGKPRNAILGMVLAGEVESTGKDVTRFQPGDRVYASTGTRFGCYAETICLPEISKPIFPASVASVLAPAPANLSDEEAAAIPYGGLLALHFVKRGHIQRGQKVLVYGASGAIGTAAVQLAKHFGAEVTGVCSTRNLDLVQSLGADHLIDYTRETLADRGESYDFILDAVGKKKSSALKEECEKALTPNGQYISVDEGTPKPQLEDLFFLTELAEAGALKPVIDRSYPLEEIVAAHRYVDQGHKQGNVVITVAHPN